MKLTYKIIVFLFLILFFVVVLFFWWRSLGEEEAPTTPGNEGIATSSFNFSEVPLAETSPLFKDVNFSEADIYTGPLDSHGEPLFLSEESGVAPYALSRLSDQAAFAYWAIKDTGGVFYMTPNGKVFSVEEGDDLEVSSQELPSLLRKALPSRDGRLILGLFGTLDNPRWGMYDTIDTVWRPLPQGIEDAAWGATNEVVLVRRREGGLLQLGTINVSDSALPFTLIIQDFRLKHVSMHALSLERVLLVEDPALGTRSRIWELNSKTLALRALSTVEEGVLIHVSPRRDFILKYASPDLFQVLDANFEEQAPLFFLTLPQKCGFDEDNVFCFRPQEDFSDQPAFFDDYFKKRIFTVDSLIAFGPNDLGEDTLFTSGGPDAPPIDGIYPMFAKGKYTFLNRYDGYVYQLGR